MSGFLEKQHKLSRVEPPCRKQWRGTEERNIFYLSFTLLFILSVIVLSVIARRKAKPQRGEAFRRSNLGQRSLFSEISLVIELDFAGFTKFKAKHS
jgi:hypothetical protein